MNKVLSLINLLSYLAIPVSCAALSFGGAFGFWPISGSLTLIFGGLTVMWMQLWFWSCTFVSIGILLKKIRNTNLYIWFEYPGLIIMSIFALVYAGALLLRFDIASSFLAISAFIGIGLRFFFRWLEVHLLLTEKLRENNIRHRKP